MLKFRNTNIVDNEYSQRDDDACLIIKIHERASEDLTEETAEPTKAMRRKPAET